jgi:hypothetical protein
MSESAGQASERTPDFIPGWFAPRPGNPDPATREAVRLVDLGSFPIQFLRSTEMVHPPRSPQRGICIGNARHSEMELAVPPGYWIVRDSDGELRNWRDEDFRAKYTRSAQEWIAPVERPKEPLPSDEAIWFCKIGVADRAALPQGADAPLRQAVEQAFEQLTGREADFNFSGWGGELDEGERNAVAASAQTRREMAVTDGWKGTPPAEGTRRALIRDTIGEFAEILGYGGGQIHDRALDLADAVESALLKSTIDNEALERGAEAMTAGIENVVLEEGDGPPSGLRFSERALWQASEPESTLRVVLDRLARIRDHRDDEWVQDFAMAAITAGQECEVAFPADVLDRLLREHDVRPSLPRNWPTRGDSDIGKQDLPQPGEAELEDAGQIHRKGTPERRLVEHRAEQASEKVEAEEQSRFDRVLEQREEARAGEDHWKAQRDAALRLLQWTIPDLMGHPSDILGADLKSDDPDAVRRFAQSQGVTQLPPPSVNAGIDASGAIVKIEPDKPISVIVDDRIEAEIAEAKLREPGTKEMGR